MLLFVDDELASYGPCTLLKFKRFRVSSAACIVFFSDRCSKLLPHLTSNVTPWIGSTNFPFVIPFAFVVEED
jgi:hypothetical protein